MKKIAVILAGGQGQRFGSGLPKQFIELHGKPIIFYTVSAFCMNPSIDSVVIVCNKNYINLCTEIFPDNFFSNFGKVGDIIPGGRERYESTMSAVDYCSKKYGDCYLVIHDAVRPFVTQKIITECCDSISSHQAVETAIKITDTIFIKDDSEYIFDIPPREVLRSGQGPAVFSLSLLQSVYRKALDDLNFAIPTSDAHALRRYLPDIKIFLIEGDPFNFKITYEKDFFIASYLIEKKFLDILR